MRYLVTGGAGFIGSRIAARLVSDGNEVCVIDNLRTGNSENIPEGTEFHDVDIRYADQLSSLKPNFDAILHLAGQSSGEISHDDPDYDLDANARGTLNLLRWAHGNDIKRFLNASSMSVYGQVAEKECPVLETAATNPLSFYGCSKLAAEKYCTYFMTKEMAVTSFRMFNVYGPGQNLSNLKQGMVSIYLAYLLQGEAITVKGSPQRFRDFIFIDDVVEAWVKSITAEITFNKVYNLSTGKKTLVSELLSQLKTAFGREDAEVIFSGATPADQMGIFASSELLQNDVGWKPQVTLDQGLASLAEYYLIRSVVHKESSEGRLSSGA